MEYTFRNFSREDEVMVRLNDFSIAVRCGNVNSFIPFANIMSVRLRKDSNSLYKIIIHHGTGKLLVITNQYFTADGTFEDRSRMYATFVRVLHYHLKDKSTAVYESGCSKVMILKVALISVIFSFVISFTTDFLGFRLLEPYFEALILTFIFFAITFFLFVGQLPKEYTSTDIPLNLLP